MIFEHAFWSEITSYHAIGYNAVIKYFVDIVNVTFERDNCEMSVPERGLSLHDIALRCVIRPLCRRPPQRRDGLHVQTMLCIV